MGARLTPKQLDQIVREYFGPGGAGECPICPACGEDLEIESRSVAGLDRGPPLQFAELCRHGHHGPLDGSDLFVSRGEQFSEDVAGDVDGRVGLVVDLPVVGGVADVAFRVLHDAVRSDDRVAQGLGADNHLVVFVEEDDRGSGELTFLVGQRDRFAVLVEVGQAGVGGAQVDPDRVGSLRIHFESVRLCRPELRDDRATTSARGMARGRVSMSRCNHVTITAPGPPENRSGSRSA